MASSILHRATGIVMAVGFILLVGWLFDAASGPEVYAGFVDVMDSTLGWIVLVGLSWAFFYHLANGIRHLVWDTGRGLEKEQATASAWFVIVASIVLTAIFWWVAS
jgi:succinate dehydrogenase / fumarate reductase cytochrome b subunit